jgi:hypothetical protein
MLYPLSYWGTSGVISDGDYTVVLPGPRQFGYEHCESIS